MIICANSASLTRSALLPVVINALNLDKLSRAVSGFHVQTSSVFEVMAAENKIIFIDYVTRDA